MKLLKTESFYKKLKKKEKKITLNFVSTITRNDNIYLWIYIKSKVNFTESQNRKNYIQQ